MKKLNTIIMAVLLAMLVVFASGCGNAEVDIVKSGILGNYRSLTVGNALDNYSHFANRDWRVIETENGKKVVEFRGAYDIEPLFKNTNIKQIYLLIQFLINADGKSFELTYIGREVIQKDGKVKNKKLYSREILDDVYQNKETMSYVLPKFINIKGQRFGNKTLGEILDNYKYFKSTAWKDSTPYFCGILKLDSTTKGLNIKQEKIMYGCRGFILSKEYSDGKVTRSSIDDKKDSMKILTELGSNQKISLFNSYPKLCGSLVYDDYSGAKIYFGKKREVEVHVLAELIKILKQKNSSGKLACIHKILASYKVPKLEFEDVFKLAAVNKKLAAVRVKAMKKKGISSFTINRYRTANMTSQESLWEQLTHEHPDLKKIVNEKGITIPKEKPNVIHMEIRSDLDSVYKVDEFNRKSYNTANVIVVPNQNSHIYAFVKITYTVQLKNSGKPKVEILDSIKLNCN